MPELRRTALPEGVPAEGLKIVCSEDEHDLEEQFANLAENGYVPAGRLEVKAHYDTDAGQWRTFFALPLWKVGNGVTEDEEMYR